MTTAKFSIGQRVKGIVHGQNRGLIASEPFILHPGSTYLCYAVRLDDGFYSEGRQNFVSVLVVCEDGLVADPNAE